MVCYASDTIVHDIGYSTTRSGCTGAVHVLEKCAERRLSADRPENKHCNVTYKSCYAI